MNSSGTREGSTNFCTRCGTEIPSNKSYCADCENFI